MPSFKQFLADESGATAIEYGLIAALIAVAIIAALNALSGNLQNTFNYVGNQLTTATGN
jgi:pilus assembly protein Flp/PilA